MTKKKKKKKTKKKRAHKYEKKLVILGSFEDVLKVSTQYIPAKK